MKVLFVTSEKGFRGGERQVALLGEGLRARGFEVGLCAPPGAKLLESFERRWACPMANELDLRGALGIARAARELGADLVHAFTARAHGLALFARPPLVVTRAVAFTAGRNAIGRFKYSHAARLIAVSSAAAGCLEQAGVPRERIDVIPPAMRFEGISADRARAREKLGLKDGVVAIGTAGALEEGKGFSDLLAAAHLLKSPGPRALILFGEGALRARLEAEAAGIPGTEVRFLGQRDDLQELLAGLDLYVQPSRVEGFGLAAAEAMAAGVLVVATDAGGLRDLVEDGRTGLRARAGDPASIAAAIERALAEPSAARIRADAAAWVRAHLAPEAMVEATLATYRKALER